MSAPALQTLPLEVALQQAVAHHQAGRLQEAEQLYRAILQAQPGQPDANHNLGVLAIQVGQHAAGLPYLKAALEAYPAQGQYWLSYAEALLATGQSEDALNLLQTALQRGLDTPAAQALQRKIQASMPNDPTPGNTPTPAEMAQIATLFNTGQYAELENRTRLLLEQYPDSGFAWKVLGASLQAQGKEALPALQKATELSPDDAEAYGNLGAALKDLGQFNDAKANFLRALEINPNFAEAHCNLGSTLKDLGCFDSAAASFRRALEINPDFVEAHLGLGLCLLATGRYSEGWREYEYRWEGAEPKLSRPATTLPQYTGQQHLPGDRLLVFEEQGWGDRLQFVRYLRLAADSFPGGVTLVSCSPLLALFRRSFPGLEILDAIPADQNAWQWQCPLLSLPLAFGSTLETIPKQTPYLVPDPVRVVGWQTRVAALKLPPLTRKIGLVWKKGSFMKTALKYSLTLQQLAPLLNLPDCVWFSLQKEPDPDKTLWVASGKLIDWTEEFGDFDDTAALAMNLDLIVSVDTSVAHLAGGLGRPTWLFNPHTSNWRWMFDREDSPWYPTMRIFTQKETGAWDEVVMRMAETLTGQPATI